MNCLAVGIEENESPVEAAWRKYPQLAYAYPDFGAFRQNYEAGQITPFVDFSDRIFVDNEFQQAAVRLEVATRPSDAGAREFSATNRVGGRLTIWAYGPIARSGNRPYGGFIDEAIAAVRQQSDIDAIVLRIDSCGGFASLGYDLALALKDHKARKVAIIDRACWSAAVLLAAACDRVAIRQSASLMIHPNSVAIVGNAVALANLAEACRSDDARLVRFLSRRRRISEAKLFKLLPQEKFLTSAEAVSIGLADINIPDLPTVASVAVSRDDHP